MTGEIDQQQAPHVGLLEGPLERHRQPAVQHEHAQDLDRIVADEDVGW